MMHLRDVAILCTVSIFARWVHKVESILLEVHLALQPCPRPMDYWFEVSKVLKVEHARRRPAAVNVMAVGLQSEPPSIGARYRI